MRHEAPINIRRSMLASSNSDFALLNGIPSCSLGKPIFVGGARQPWLLNERMPLFFGVKYGHMKRGIALFDYQRPPSQPLRTFRVQTSIVDRLQHEMVR